MVGCDENIVREYFELNGFLVRQLKKREPATRKKRLSEERNFIVQNPALSAQAEMPGFQLFSNDVPLIFRALVVVKGWDTTRYTPAMLRSSTQTFNFLKKEVVAQTDYSFDEEDAGLDDLQSCLRLIILPALPTQEIQRQELFEMLKASGLDAVLTIRTILENLLRGIEPNHSYPRNDSLQLLRLLKVYDLVKDPQMELFKK